MRIRQIKPAFWSDSRLAELPEGTRLFYVGLWMVADDAGWFRWDAVEVARDLYGYEGRARRERRAAVMFTQLVDAHRIVVYPCGHAEVPKLGEHQHLSTVAKQVRTVFNEHLKGCVSRIPAETRGSPQIPAEARLGNGKERVMVGEGTVGEGKETARADAPHAVSEETEFQRLVPRGVALGRSA